MRPGSTISIPGPLTLTYTFADNTLLDLNSISGMNYDGIAPVIETDTTTNSTTITYQMNSGIPAGADISLPIYFSSKTGIPENSTIALSSELKAGATVLATQNGAYTFKSLDPSVEMSFRPYPNETKWDYLIAQPAPFYIDYNKVGGSGTITDGRIRFMLEDNTYVSKLNASDLSSADAKEYIYDSNNKIIGVDYYYRSLIAGQTLAIPLEVVTQTFYTPDNYELKFNVTVVEPDGQGGFAQVTEPVTGSFTYHAIRPTLRKYHAINRYVDYTTTNRAFGGFDQNNDGLIDADGAALQRFDFKLTQAYSTQNVYGVRMYNPITITDTLPEGAVFDPAVNPGWSYVEGSTTQVTYTKTTDTIVYATNGVVDLLAPLYLSFPDYPYTATSTSNSAEVILTPKNGLPNEFDNGSVSLTDDLKLFFNVSVPKGSISKSGTPLYIADQLTAKRDTEIRFNVVMQNPNTDMYMKDVALDDFDLDPRLSYTGISIYPYYTNKLIGPDGEAGSGRLRILALDANDQILGVIAENHLTSDSTVLRNIPDGTKKIRVLTQEGTLIPPQERISIYVYAKFHSPEEVSYSTTSTSSNYLRNYAQATYGWDGFDVTDSTVKAQGTVYLRPYEPKLQFNKSISPTNPTLFYNQKARVTLSLVELSSNPLMPPDPINGLRFVDLLPENVEYVPGSVYFTNSTGNPDNNYVLASKEPEIVPNYKGTSRTALIWDFASISSYKAYSTNYYINLSFEIVTTMTTTPGLNTNQAYAIWENNAKPSATDQVQQIQVGTRPQADIYDLDDDTNLTEMVASAAAQFTFMPPAELIITKSVQGNLDTTVVSTGGRTYIGGSGNYYVNVLNKTDVPVKSATVIDVIPHIGDYNIVPDINGNYAPRGSAFPITLTGPVTVSAETATFDILYNTRAKTNNETPENYALDPGWVSNVSDYTTVKAIKMVMTSGELKKDQGAVFTIPMIAPYDVHLRDGQKANNSAAVSTGGKFTESRVSSLVINNVVVQGTVFSDFNVNSYKDGTVEPGISGVKVHLMIEKRDENGNFIPGEWEPAMNYTLIDGVLTPTTPITAITDIYGKFRMEAFYSGNYKLVFERPENYVPTATASVLDPNASHILLGADPQGPTHETAPFTVTTSNYRITRNAGYLYGLGDLKITKVLTNANGIIQAQGKRDFTYEIKVAGQPYTVADSVEIIVNNQGVLESSRVTPDAQGRFTMKNGNTAYVRGLALNAAYSVVEVDSALYDVTPASASYSGTVKQNENLLPFTNQEKDNGSLTIKKELYDSNGNLLSQDDREFYFRVFGPSFTGSSISGGQTFSLKAGESFTLTDLKYGRYYVYEQADANYNKVIVQTDYSVQYRTNTSVSSSFGSQDIQFENREAEVIVRNTERPLGKLRVSKTLWDNAGVQLTDSRYFQYRLTGPSYPNGILIGIYSNGNISNFSNLKYGTYTLEEIDYNNTYNRYDINYVHSDGKDPATITEQVQGTGAGQGPISFEFSFDNRADIQTLEIQNSEKAIAKLTVYKQVRTASGSLVWNDTRPFNVTISGDNLPADYPNKTRTFSVTDPAVFEDLPYGSYTVTETEANNEFYNTSYSPTSASQTLTVNYPNSNITITNYEKDIGELRLTKEVLAADGTTKLWDGRSFWVRITGPQLSGSRNFEITNEVDAMSSATKVRYGTYTIEEINVDGSENLDDYTTSVNGTAGITTQVTIQAYDPDNPTAHIANIKVVNQEKPLGKLTIEKILKDSDGNQIAADTSRNFNVTVTGPSYPDGKTLTINNALPVILPDATDLTNGISGLMYGTYTVVEDTSGSNYDLTASTTTGTAVLSVTAKEGRVNLVNQEKRDGKIVIKKIMFDQDGQIDSVSREIIFEMSGGDLAQSYSQVLKTGGSDFPVIEYPEIPKGPRDGVGTITYDKEQPDSTEVFLKYGSYSISEFMPRYTGTEYEINVGVDARVIPRIVDESEENWAYASNSTEAAALSGNSFTVTLDTANPVREYTIYNRILTPTDGVYEATKVWVGGKSDPNHPHSGNANLLQLYRRLRPTTDNPNPPLELVPATGYILEVTNVTADMAAIDPSLDTSLESYYHYKWTNLEVLGPGSSRYIYYATEPTVPTWYSADYGANPIELSLPGGQTLIPVVGNGGIISNRYTPGIVTLSAEKLWEDGPDPKPQTLPLVIMRSYEKSNAEGQIETVVEAVREEILTAAGDPSVWQASFTDLPAADTYGHIYTYYALEGKIEAGQYVEVLPDSYQLEAQVNTAVTGGFSSLITNKYEPPVGEIKATKAWHVDAESAVLYPGAYLGAREDIWMQLYRLPENAVAGTAPELVADSRKLLAVDAPLLTLTWPNMPLKTTAGETYVYSVKEVDSNGVESWTPLNFNKVENGLEVHNNFKTVRPGKLTLTKHLLDANGYEYGKKDVDGQIPYPDPVIDREFVMVVTGPFGYHQEVVLKAGETKTLDNLAYGNYSIVEDDIDTTLYEAAQYLPSSTVEISLADSEADIEITNKEKAVGSLSLKKLIMDHNGQYIINKLFPENPELLELDEREFSFKVEGPIYPDVPEADFETHIVVSNSNVEKLLQNLPLGKYRISEVNTAVSGTTNVSDLYTMPDFVEVTLDARHQSHEVSLTNVEKAVGQITVHKILKDANGNVLPDDGRRFTVLLSSEALAAPQQVVLAAGETHSFEQLPLGASYTLVELDTTAMYTTSYSLNSDGSQATTDMAKVDLTLELGAQFGFAKDVYVTNSEKQIGQISLSKQVVNTSGGIGASNPAAPDFEVRVTGPSGYNQIVKLPADGTTIHLNDLLFGHYSFEELPADGYNLDDYTVTNPQVTLGYDAVKDETVLFADLQVKNVEKLLGTLEIEKVLLDALGNDITQNNTRSYNITVFGPQFAQEGERMTLSTAGKIHLPVGADGIKYGTYSVQEDDYSYEYDTTISSSVEIHTGNKNGVITVTNQEKALGVLTATILVYDAQGNLIEDDRIFDIRAFGPSLEAGGRLVEMVNGIQRERSGLIYGEYSLTFEQLAEIERDYEIIKFDPPVTLAIGKKAGHIDIALKERPLGKLTVSAEVLDANGLAVPPGRFVSVTVYGPSFPEGREVSITTGQPFPVLEGLIYGEYTVSADDPDYQITLPDPVTLSIENKEDILHTVFKERADAKLTVSAEVLDVDGNPVPNGRVVTVTVYGPSFPEGREVSITTGQAFPVLEDLKYGEYTVEADDPNYQITLPEPVTLSIENKEDTLHTVFKEKADAKLTVSAEVLDADGQAVPPGRVVTVTVYGPSFPEGHEVSITTGQPFPVLEDLKYGEYTVTANDPNYQISLPEAVTLSIEDKEDTLHTIFKEKADAKLTVSAEVLDVEGNPVPDGRVVTVTVYGPSFPEGQEVSITTGQPFPVLEGLKYGEYTVEATDPNYQITLPDPVTLSIENKDDSLHTVFKEKADAKLTVSAEVLDADGQAVPPGRVVTVTVYGPSFPEGREVSITTGQPFPVLEDVKYGEYSVMADDPNYQITLPEAVTLSIVNKEDNLHTVFKERADAKLTVSAEVLDAAGNPVPSGRIVTVTVFGPSFPDGKELTLTTGQPFPVLEDLKYGEYSVKATDPNYQITVPDPVTLSIENKEDSLHTVFKEKADGKLTVSAEVLDADGQAVPPGRVVTVTVYGPSFPEGKEVSITTGQPFPVLEGLEYGEYTVTADDPNYLITLPEAVTLSMDKKEDTLHAVFKEEADAKLTVSAEVLDAAGNPVPAGRVVTVTVFGPSFPDGKEITITTGQPFPVLEDLKYGEYRVEAEDPNYLITLPKAVELSLVNKEDRLHSIFREKTDAKLTISAEVLDADGKPVPDGRVVTVTVYGPSYPEGKEISITTGQPFPVLEGLAYGEYKVQANDPNYSIVLPGPVTLSLTNLTAELHTVFKEKTDGRLTVSAEVLDSTGKAVPDGREVTVTVYGPSLPEGRQVTIVTGKPFPVLEGLIYGEYRVEAKDPRYTIVLPKAVTLSIGAKEAELMTIFKEPAVASTSTKPTGGSSVPRTGEAGGVNGVMVGLAFALAGLLLGVRRRREKK